MEENDDFNQIEKTAIYQKGKEIYEVVKLITDLIPENNEQLSTIKGMMLHDAALLSSKIAAAEAAGLYDLKMEAATIIRKAARDLKVCDHTLAMFDFKEVAYFDMVRKHIEEYRLLFIDWVAGFDKWDYAIDRWGLFNPPGVSPFDKDPDDDLPF